LLPDEIHALIDGDARLASELAGVTFPDAWPAAPEAREGLAWHLRHLLATPDHVPWRVRVIADASSMLVIGSINLKGPPADDGDVEIGWGLSEDYRGRGYALEAARAVIEWAAADSRARTFSATIPEDNQASARLAANLGMMRTGFQRRNLPLWMMERGRL
jgi:RimJ/RimL family protein N-acetyltransferase